CSSAGLDNGLAFENHEEVTAREPSPQDALALCEDALLVRLRDRLQLRRREVGEEGELAQGLGDAHQAPAAPSSRSQRSTSGCEPDAAAIRRPSARQSRASV